MTAHDGEDQRRSAQAQGDPRRGDHGVLSNGYLGARMDEIANRFARRQLRALSGQACSVLGGVLSRAAGRVRARCAWANTVACAWRSDMGTL
jgi:hypothetical protein